jgi:lipopolysaccharide export system protein LptA
VRNQEAARYGRWAAIAAGLIVLAVAGVYVQRAMREARARRAAPPIVPATVQQRSADFSYSDVEQGRTIFTIRASRATQFRDQNRALLEDVWISIYGRQGDRDENIHTRECSYEPLTGAIRCQGEVQIDIQSADPASHKPQDELQVITRDLKFNRETGEASTAEPVDFRFPAGQGHGVGIHYSTRDAILRVEHGVTFDLKASERSGGVPVRAAGSSLEIRRDERVVVLDGPATVQQGSHELSAEKISVQLDPHYHAQRVIAEGDPRIHGADGSGTFSVSAKTFAASLSPEGWIEHIVADGSIDAVRQSAGDTDRLSAGHVDFAMLPEKNAVREMVADGGVVAESREGDDSRVLKTAALRVTFSSEPRPVQTGADPPDHSRLPSVDGQRIEKAETLGPATVESKAKNELTSIKAKKLVARFNHEGRLEKLLGDKGVEVRRQVANSSPEISSAEELTASFESNGEWGTLDEAGNVHFAQADRKASAEHATVNHATGMMTLEGSPVLSDAASRTTAGNVTINQQSGEVHAAGGVVSTYLGSAKTDEVNLGAGAAHISAESLQGSSASGHIVYSGHARLWQGESVLESDQIEIWRDDRKLLASGGVVAVFPQAAGPSFGESLGKTEKAPAGPMLWQVRAPSLAYWSDQGKAAMDGGVVAQSDQGTLEASTLDVFLTPAGSSPSDGKHSASERASPGTATSGTASTRGQELSRVVAEGSVVVKQGDRRATGERAVYTAADGKFVLSGGQPMITDASSDTTTGGHSLTFFVANDTILIDSQHGSRTLTRHRVEK